MKTIGTRRPRLDLLTVRRAFEKARQWLCLPVPGQEPSDPTVLNPRMWPYFRSGFDRRLNRGLLRRQLMPVVEASRLPVIAVTTIPIVADLVGLLPVPHLLDLLLPGRLRRVAGIGQEALWTMETQLVRRVHSVIAVSEHLQRKFAVMEHAHILTHGTDLAHWAEGDSATLEGPLAHLPGPLVVFWGVVDRRMDVAMLERLGADLDRGTIVLLAPRPIPTRPWAACPDSSGSGRSPTTICPRSPGRPES